VNYDKNAKFQHRFSQKYKNATYAPLPLNQCAVSTMTHSKHYHNYY